MSVSELACKSTLDQYIPDAMNWRGPWNIATQYYYGDVVLDTDAESYVCIASLGSKGSDPSATPAQWALMSSGVATAVSIISTNGSGISVSESPANTFSVGTNLLAGSGISLTPSGINTAITVANSGVLSVSTAPGSGIAIGGTAANPTVANSGVLSVSAGSGITVGGTAQNPSVAITSVTSSQDIVSGAIASQTATGPGTVAFITIPSIGSSNIPVVVGGLYAFSGIYSLVCSNIGPAFGTDFGCENGAVDTYVVRAPNAQYVAGSPLSGVNIPFCFLVKATVPNLQFFVSNGNTAAGGDTSSISIGDLYFTRIA